MWLAASEMSPYEAAVMIRIWQQAKTILGICVVLSALGHAALLGAAYLQQPVAPAAPIAHIAASSPVQIATVTLPEAFQAPASAPAELDAPPAWEAPAEPEALAAAPAAAAARASESPVASAAASAEASERAQPAEAVASRPAVARAATAERETASAQPSDGTPAAAAPANVALEASSPARAAVAQAPAPSPAAEGMPAAALAAEGAPAPVAVASAANAAGRPSAEASASAAAPAGTVEQRITGDGAARYLARIRSALGAPPTPANAHGEEGTVELLVVLDDRGRVVEVRVITSSGHQVLDDSALAWLEGRRLPRPPRDVRDERVAISVPVQYVAG